MPKNPDVHDEAFDHVKVLFLGPNAICIFNHEETCIAPPRFKRQCPRFGPSPANCPLPLLVMARKD